MQCGMFLQVHDGKVTGMEPREDFPVNQGRLCPKGVTAYQLVHHPQRLTTPLIRRGGELQPAGWEEALDLVAGQIRAIQAKYGQDSFAVISGSSLTTEKCYLMGKFARVAVGTRHVDYNGRLCMVAAAAANYKAFGVDRVANPWSDIALADVIFLAGANTAEQHPITMPYIWSARDRGARLIVADPRETPLARTAEIHLQLRPGTDSALANGLLHVMIAEGLIDAEFIRTRTTGFDAVKDLVLREYGPEQAAAITGVPADRIIEAARLWGRAQRSWLGHARGVEHQIKGVENVLTYINLVLASGRIGRPGCGYGTLTGQGNGQGGREHGQKADQLPGQRSIHDPAAREHIARIWNISPEQIPGEGYSLLEIMQAAHRGEIKGLLIICHNPMVSLPDLTYIRQALENLEFLCVIDHFPSETCELADVVLAGSAWAEDEGTTTNIEGRVVKINKAADPPGNARRDWEIIVDLARRLGQGERFNYRSPGQIWDELRAASRGGKADYYGITYEKIERQQGVFWPCPTEDHPGTPRLFEDRFWHPDGRARFHAVPYRPPAEVPDAEYPLYLSSGRVVFHYLSGNQTRRVPFLLEQCPEPYLEIHPETAARYGLQRGDLVRVVSRRGEVTLPVMVTATIRPDTVFIPYHWGPPRAANQVTILALDPLAKIPEFKVGAVRLERV